MPTTLSILFDNPHWVAILEQFDQHSVRVARHVFGSEPSDAEIYAFIQHQYLGLAKRLSPPVDARQMVQRRINPKRQQRLIKKQIADLGIATKSQEALRLQREANKREKSKRKKGEDEQLKQHKWDRKNQKRKQKRRGH